MLHLRNMQELAGHVGQAGAIHRSDQIPTFFEGVAGRDFAEHMLARLKRGNGLAGVERDRRRYADGIHVRIVQELFEIRVRRTLGSTHFAVF